MMKLIAVLIVGFLTTFSVIADNSPIRFKESMWDGRILRILIEGPRYLDPNLEFEISPPPLNNSEITKSELNSLERYAKQSRTPDQVRLIKKEATGGFVDMYIDTSIVPKRLGKMATRILKMADRECQYFVVKYKKRFSRPRPSQLSQFLTLVVPNPGHAAYPSGHATQAMLLSKILGAIDPSNAKSYDEYALDMAKRREIAGVHYPSDSKSGQKLAIDILKELMTNEEFKNEFNQIADKFAKEK